MVGSPPCLSPIHAVNGSYPGMACFQKTLFNSQEMAGMLIPLPPGRSTENHPVPARPASGRSFVFILVPSPPIIKLTVLKNPRPRQCHLRVYRTSPRKHGYRHRVLRPALYLAMEIPFTQSDDCTCPHRLVMLDAWSRQFLLKQNSSGPDLAANLLSPL